MSAERLALVLCYCEPLRSRERKSRTPYASWELVYDDAGRFLGYRGIEPRPQPS